tara:strand:+ start:284 stop:1153 length:870 start_codon:yes stop_codon:yes gene_type:complete
MAITKVTNPVTDFDKSTNLPGLKIPSGNNSNQPTGVQGMIRNNTSENTGGSVNAIEHHNGTAWKYFAATESSVYPTNLKMFLDAGDAASYNGSGTTWSDLTSNTNNGTLTNMTSSNWNNAGYFNFINSNSNYIQLPNILTFGSSSYTISIWVNLDNTTHQEYLSSYNSSGNGFLLDHTGSGNVRFYNTGGTLINIGTGTGVATTNTWQLWTVTMDRSSATNVVKLYLGSAQKATTSGTSLGSTNGDNPQIGGYPGANSLYLDGQVSKARIYDTALIQSEIQVLVNEGPL